MPLQDMPARSTPGILAGGWIGLILTVPLVAILYAGYRLASLPFIPFNLFDWGTRVLPGVTITTGIDWMVRIIHWLNVSATSTAAKLAEQTMAVAGFLLAGIIAGLIIFAILRSINRRFALAGGLIAGGLLGVAALIVNGSIDRTAATVSPAVRALWIMLLFLAWGAALGWAFARLSRAPADETASSTEPTDRRRFLIRLSEAAAVLSIVGVALGRMVGKRETIPHEQEASRLRTGPWSANHPLPNANASVKPAPGTRLELTPVDQHYRIDINTVPPVIDEASWRLRIGGLVAQPLALTLDDLRRRPQMHQFITLSCISNTVGGDLIGSTRWTGVSLQHLLPDLGLNQRATHLKIHSADGFYEIVALDTIRADERVMLAYAWDGLPLPVEHGFPLRIYIPDRYGMKQPKWIESIEATDHSQPGYWVTRGWDQVARMKATSVIDTIASNMMIGQPSPGMRVPIGGIAHAGVRGISKVELKVDDGEWQQAELRTPVSGQTWVIWRYDWPIQKGKHTFTVRCFEGDGTPQIEQDAPPHPSGATGLHVRSAMF